MGVDELHHTATSLLIDVWLGQGSCWGNGVRTLMAKIFLKLGHKDGRTTVPRKPNCLGKLCCFLFAIQRIVENIEKKNLNALWKETVLFRARADQQLRCT